MNSSLQGSPYAYAFVGVFIPDAIFIGGKYLIIMVIYLGLGHRLLVLDYSHLIIIRSACLQSLLLLDCICHYRNDLAASLYLN